MPFSVYLFLAPVLWLLRLLFFPCSFLLRYNVNSTTQYISSIITIFISIFVSTYVLGGRYVSDTNLLLFNA